MNDDITCYYKLMLGTDKDMYLLSKSNLEKITEQYSDCIKCDGRDETCINYLKV